MSSILVFRGDKVLLDSDLAASYQVETKVLTRAVRRNAERCAIRGLMKEPEPKRRGIGFTTKIAD